MTDATTNFSRSEDAGVEQMPADAKNIYSVGISTGGVAEMRMAQKLPGVHIIATTVDEKGVEFAQQRIAEAGLSDQIEAKLEDVAEPLPYADESFDYIYARLVLHYLTKTALQAALAELHRTLRSTGKLFVVVRSTDCPDAKREGTSYNPETGLTTCTVNEDGRSYSYARYFHTQQSITAAMQSAGFAIDSVEQYDEQLFKDFMRTELSENVDNVIQVVATK